MHIVILQWSPDAKGSTVLMVEEFSRGAREAGHDVLRVDVDRLQVRPCTGCVACGYEGPCAVHDDMQDLRAKILAAVNEWYARTGCIYEYYDPYNVCPPNKLKRKGDIGAEPDFRREAHYDTLVRYLQMQDVGRVLGRGCGTLSMTRSSRYPDEAYRLGRSL